MRDTTKIIQALLFFASKFQSKKISTIKAYKLIWLADRLHLRKYGRTITGDIYYALPKGIVPTDAKHIIDGKQTIKNNTLERDNYIFVFKNGTYKALKDFDPYFFSETDIETLNQIFEAFGSFSAKQLSQLSHKYPEWKAYEDLLKDETSKNSHRVDMNLFFENNQDGEDSLFSQPQDELDLSKALFNGVF